MKFLYNNKIRKMLSEDNIGDLETIRSPIPVKLEEILAQGFEYAKDCIFLKCNVGNLRNVSEADFPDKTGLECFINKINIDEYTDEDTSAAEMLKVGISSVNFIGSCLQKWNAKFAIIYSMQDDDFVVTSLRFHTCREGEVWINDNLELYEDAVLVAYVN